jgi:hypothetical protein
MNGNFLELNAPMALLALTLAARAMSDVSGGAFMPLRASPDAWSEQQLVPVCEAAPPTDRGYIGSLTDSLLATAGGDGVALPDRAGSANAC